MKKPVVPKKPRPLRVKKRQCLKCSRIIKRAYPGLCAQCKRHVDYKEGDDDEYPLHL